MQMCALAYDSTTNTCYVFSGEERGSQRASRNVAHLQKHQIGRQARRHQGPNPPEEVPARNLPVSEK